jgi:hypothetical protein
LAPKAERRTCHICKKEDFVRRAGQILLFRVNGPRLAHAFCLLKASGERGLRSIHDEDLNDLPTTVAHAFGLLDAWKALVAERKDRTRRDASHAEEGE